MADGVALDIEAELADLDARDWQRELPFLDWQPDGTLFLTFDVFGEMGYPARDGSVVEASDPRVADLRRRSKLRQRLFLRDAGEALEADYKSMSDPADESPFAFAKATSRLGFTAWLRGDNPSYCPTRRELLMRDAYSVRQMRANGTLQSRSGTEGGEVTEVRGDDTGDKDRGVGGRRRLKPAERRFLLSEMLKQWHGPKDQGGEAESDPMPIREAAKRMQCSDDTVRRAFKLQFGEEGGYDAYVASLSSYHSGNLPIGIVSLDDDGNRTVDEPFESRQDEMEFRG